MTGKHVSRPTAALLVAAISGACASVVRPSLPRERPTAAIVIDPGEAADCMRTTAGRGGVGYAPLEAPLADPAELALLDVVPADVRRVAQAAGLERSLAALLRLQASAPEERSIALVATRLQVVTRMSALEIELAALLFEADCTGDQMERALLELDRRTRKQQLMLTIASIAVGAVAGVGAGLWDLRGTESRGPAILGITGGAASAVLGLTALAPKRDRVIFPHPRNLFVPIVTGEDPERLYPPFVLRLLSAPRSAGGPTPREQLLAVWQQIVDEAVPPDERALARAVLLGSGGVYDGDLVDVRERMYDALESQLSAIDRDLELLYRFLSRLLGDAP